MTIRVREHRREDLITKVAGTSWVEGATCPTWLAFLDRVQAGNAGMIDFLQRAVGYSLCGDTSEQCLFLLYGTGANGKSTFLDTLLALFGDYGTTASFDTFLQRDRTGQATNDIARLHGVRLVVANEPDAGKRFSESVLKQLTGSDMVTARFLNKEFFSFKPQFHLWLAANHKPTITGTDEGIWRRIRLVPFSVQIPKAEQDLKLGLKLHAELPGILQWAIEGHRKWQADGLGLPPEVTAATASYRAEMDVLGGFLSEHCVLVPHAYVASAELYTVYGKWATESGERVMTQRMLTNVLTERGYELIRIGKERTRGFSGIGLLSSETDSADALGGRRTHMDTDPLLCTYTRPGSPIPANERPLRPCVRQDSAFCPQCGEALSEDTCWTCEISLCRVCRTVVAGSLRALCDRCAAKG